MIVTQRERQRGRDTGRGRSRLHAPGARRRSKSTEVPEAVSVEEQKEIEDKVTGPEKAKEQNQKQNPHLGQKPGGSDFLRRHSNFLLQLRIRQRSLVTTFTAKDLPQQKLTLVASKLPG
ncbi:unnamed protein product [Nyctereutes procyonoides]|uniref:(raccoon dog) hypothetical protein n=1 Tax=Nyctereutes procyonoides TaxID=34880 RepID=A0A811YIQ9_NYCPR|nr:unnamed protein product [Nyctereutes procyonoides]